MTKWKLSEVYFFRAPLPIVWPIVFGIARSHELKKIETVFEAGVS